MEKILIATDGSPAAREAVVFGLELAAEHGGDAVVVHVVPAVDIVPMSGFGMPGALPHTPRADELASLEDAAALAADLGVSALTKLLTGDPVDEIVAHADSIDADMIVVGSRGHGAVASALLGSVSQGVLHEARRPVLIFRRTQARVGEPVVAVS